MGTNSYKDNSQWCALFCGHRRHNWQLDSTDTVAAVCMDGDVKVIGAGWGRTGTLTLKTALEILGLPCYHMVELLSNEHCRGHAEQWYRAAAGEPVDLRQLLSGYQACVDWPTTSFYKQLMELYPHAKVILSVRSPSKWYDSTFNTVWQMAQLMRLTPWYVRALSGLLDPQRAALGRMVNSLIWQGDLQGTFPDRQAAEQCFVEWNEEVKRHVPPERLLVYEVREGWGPLCAFLGCPVPQQPFPHENDTAAFRRRVEGVRRRQTLLKYGVPAAAAAAVSVAVLLLLRRSRQA